MATGIPKSKFDSFLKKARTIIDKEGEINAGAVSKIYMAGAKQGLTKPHIDKAIELLSTSARNDPKETAFRGLVETELKREGELTPRLKHKLLACGRLQLGMTNQDAQPIIDELVTQLNIRATSAEEVRIRLDSQIHEALQVAQPGWDVMQNLYTTAHQLGMDRKHVESAAIRLQEHTAEKNKKTLLYAALIMAPLLLIGIGAGIWAMSSGSREHLPDVDDGKVVKIDPKPNPPITPPKKVEKPLPKGAKWWTNMPGMEDAVAGMKKCSPDDSEMFEGLGAEKEVDRLSALQRILLKIPDLYETKDARPHVVKLMAGLYAGEPADENAKLIASWIVSQFPRQSDRIANVAAAHFKRRVWYAKVAVASIKHPQISPERQTSLSKGLEKQLEEIVNAASEEKALLKSVSAVTCKRLFKNVLITASDNCNLALKLFDQLNEVAVPFLPEEIRHDAEADLLMAVLSQPNVDPKQVEPRLSRQFPKFDVDMKKAVITSYRSAPKEMGVAIEPILTRSVHFNIQPGMTQTQKADAMLAVLENQDRFLALAEQRSKTLSAKADQILPILQETLNLAHASTVGCALAMASAGHAELDELLKKSPVIGERTKTEEKPKKDDNKPANPVVNPPVPAPVGGPVIQGALTFADPFDVIRRGCRADIHPYPMAAGMSFRIDMVARFDTYLRLEDPLGRHITGNDDGGGGLNSRIYFTAPRSGTYRIVATAFGGGLGPYTIFVRPNGFRRFGVFPPPLPLPFPGGPVVPQEQRKVNMAQLLPAIQGLRWDINSPQQRAGRFEQIANLSDGELNPKIAIIFAEYILEYKAENEFKRKVTSLKSSKLKDSAKLKMAMVDYIGGKAKLYQSKVESVFTAMIGKDITFSDKENWRREARTVMLKHLIDNITVEEPADEAAEKLKSLYVKQGRMLGMDAAVLSKMQNPSDVLNGLIDHLSRKLQTRKLDDKDSKRLADVQQQVLVADAAADDDVHKTVLLQRQWLRLLAVYAATEQPKCAEQVLSIEKQLAVADGKANHILAQLRDGERHILQVWTLLHKAN